MKASILTAGIYINKYASYTQFLYIYFSQRLIQLSFFFFIKIENIQICIKMMISTH